MRQIAPLFVERPTSEPSGPLSATESRNLAEAEGVIRMAGGSFYNVGRALAEIRDRRLYRGKYLDFELYCREWDLSRSRVCRLIGAAEVIDHLRPLMLPIGNILPASSGRFGRY